MIDSVKDDIKPATQVKEETNNFIDSIEISKDKLSNITNKLNDYNSNNNQKVNNMVSNNNNTNISDVKTNSNVEKANINVDPDKIVINSNNAISDDEFFDDFFGDD